MSNAELPDSLWAEIEPSLPPDEVPGPKGGASASIEQDRYARNLFRVVFWYSLGVPAQGIWM